jgi:YfiH family protein
VPRLRLPLAAGGAASIVFTTRADGDLSIGAPADDLTRRRAAVVDAPWTWLRQVHGDAVVTVTVPGEWAGTDADAAVTAAPHAPLAVHAADCVPIALVAAGGADEPGARGGPAAVGAVHAGWAGLVAGVIPAAVGALRALTPAPCTAVIGPCIHPAHYEFGAADLDRVVAVAGEPARGRTVDGRPALDLPAAVRTALQACGIDDVRDLGIDTATDPDYFSHRARRDAGRHALVVWIDP